MVCCTLGWTWDQADEQLDFPRLAKLYGWWGKVPPAAASLRWIAGALGFKSESPKGPAPVAAIPPEKVAGEVLDMLIGVAPHPPRG